MAIENGHKINIGLSIESLLKREKTMQAVRHPIPTSYDIQSHNKTGRKGEEERKKMLKHTYIDEIKKGPGDGGGDGQPEGQPRYNK